MTLPNFLIIGAAKTGTTALYQYLDQHPQIFMSRNKEPFFFMMKDKEVDFRGPGDQERLIKTVVNSMEDYEALFANVKDEIAIGEASTVYLLDKETPKRIHEHIPDCKIIVGLRNPVERAWSAFMHIHRDGREPFRDFRQALDDEQRRIEAGYNPLWFYRTASTYYENLKRYYDTFPAENIMVYLYDDMKKDTAALVQAVYRFLKVDPSFEPDVSAKHNVGGLPKNKTLHQIQNFLLQPDQPLKEMLKPLFPERLRKRMLHGVVAKIRDVNMDRLTLSAEMRAELTEEFRDDILKVQELIGRDLSHWLKAPKEDLAPTTTMETKGIVG